MYNKAPFFFFLFYLLIFFFWAGSINATPWHNNYIQYVTIASTGNTTTFGNMVRIVGSHGADVVIDNTGNIDIIHRAYAVTSNSGKTILVGVPPIGKEAKFYTLPLHFEKG